MSELAMAKTKGDKRKNAGNRVNTSDVSTMKRPKHLCTSSYCQSSGENRQEVPPAFFWFVVGAEAPRDQAKLN